MEEEEEHKDDKVGDVELGESSEGEDPGDVEDEGEGYGAEAGGGGFLMLVTGNLVVDKKVDVNQLVHTGVDSHHCGEDLAD